MSANDKFPQWMRVSTSDAQSETGRYILGGKTNKDWANYGRWQALLQLLHRSPGGCLDVSDPQRFRSLTQELFGAAGTAAVKTCRLFLALLVDAGALDRESYEKKDWLTNNDAYEAYQSYQTQVRANRRNGKRGGRPRKKPSEDTDG